jgi:hypothetical protein
MTLMTFTATLSGWRFHWPQKSEQDQEVKNDYANRTEKLV